MKKIKEITQQKHVADIQFENEALTGVKLSESEFANVKFVNIKFKNIEISDCFFEDCFFEDCTFEGCTFSRTDWINGAFHEVHFDDCRFEVIVMEKNLFSKPTFNSCKGTSLEFFMVKADEILISSSNIDRCQLYRSEVNTIKIAGCQMSQAKFQKLQELSSFEIKESSFRRSIFNQLDVERWELDGNTYEKHLLFACKTFPQEEVQAILQGGGRTKSLSGLLIGNPWAISILVLFFILGGIGGAMVIYHPHFLYTRYIIEEAWKDRMRIYFSKEMDVLLTLSFHKRDLIPTFNRAIIEKRAERFDSSRELLKDCLFSLSGEGMSYEFSQWFANEILIVTKKEEKWTPVVTYLENNFEGDELQEVRLFIIKSFRRRYFFDTTMKTIRLFLKDSKNDLERISDLVNFVNQLPSFYFRFKPVACQVISSFLLRKAREYPDQKKHYIYMKNSLDEWMKFYDSNEAFKVNNSTLRIRLGE